MAAESIAASDPTGWFEGLYVAAEAGQTAVPWDRGEPSRYLTGWAAARALRGAGPSAAWRHAAQARRQPIAAVPGNNRRTIQPRVPGHYQPGSA